MDKRDTQVKQQEGQAGRGVRPFSPGRHALGTHSLGLAGLTRSQAVV